MGLIRNDLTTPQVWRGRPMAQFKKRRVMFRFPELIFDYSFQ